MSSDGYVPISALLSCNAKKLHTYTQDDIKNVVTTNDKQRFKLETKFIIWHTNDKKGGGKQQLSYSFADSGGQEELCIRANQGHSIKGVNFDELLTPIPNDELKQMNIIIHGTNKSAWEDHIQHKGLNRMNRNHIHFAPGLPQTDGVISGMRKSCDIHIYINGALCAADDDNIQFYKSDNGVILTSGVNESGTLPCQFFQKVVNVKTNQTLLIDGVVL